MSGSVLVARAINRAITAELIEMPLGGDSHGPKGPCIRGATDGRHLANTAKGSVLGGDAGCR